MALNANSRVVTMAAALLEEEAVAERDAIWKVFADRTEAIEDKFKPPLRAAFTKQEASVQAKLKGKRIPDTSDAVYYIFIRASQKNSSFGFEALFKASEEAEAAAEKFVDTIYTAAAWQETFTLAMLPFVTQAYLEAGNAAFVEVGLEATFNVTNPRAQQFLRDRVFDNVKGINDETREKLKRALIKGFDRGESIPQISKRIAGVFDINRGSRTDKIARTEIVGTSNNGTHQGYVDSGLVLTEMWIDSRDSLVRTSPHNHKIDGEVVKLGKRFSNGLLHPHDPGGAAGNVINCRCTSRAKKLKEAA